MLSNQLHLHLELFTLNLSTHKKSEVELRVAQELKNNQDFIYDTNQSLQNLSTSLIALSLQDEKLRTMFESDKKSKEIAYENMVAEVSNKVSAQEKRMSNFEHNIVKLLQETQGRMKLIEDNMVCHDVLDQKIIEIAEWLGSLEVSLEKLKNLVTSSNTRFENMIVHDFNQLRLLIPKEDVDSKNVKTEVEELLKSMRVDFEGLVREISLVKKALAYDDKKFENIYTLIERLKAGQK